MMPRIVNSCGDHFGSTSADLLGISIPIRAVLADQSASVFGSGIHVLCYVLCIITRLCPFSILTFNVVL